MSLLLKLAGYSKKDERASARAALEEDRKDLLAVRSADEGTFREAMARRAQEPGINLGCVDNVPYRLTLGELKGLFGWANAGTGSGKSRLFGGMAADLVRLIADGTAAAVVVIDLKGELVDLVLRALADTLRHSSPGARARMLSQLYVIRLFSRFVPELQLLSRDPTVPIFSQAHAIAENLESAVAGLGVRQSDDLTMRLAIGIERGLTMSELRYLIYDDAQLRALGERSGLPEVRLFVARRMGRQSPVTVDGVAARIDSLLRVPALKAAVAGPRMFDFRRCFVPGAITLIDGGNVPLGAEGPRKAVLSVLFTRFAAAVFDPSVVSSCPTIAIGDEIQELLTPSTTHAVERLVTQGRFRGLGLWSIHQSAVQLPGNLQTILNTNARIRVVGRCGADDARAAAEWLPITGRVPKALPPGVPPPIVPQFLTASEEQRHRTAELSRLPERHFLVADRLAPFSPRVVVARPFDPPPWEKIPDEFRVAVECGAIGVPRDTLLARAEELEARVAGTVTTAPVPNRRSTSIATETLTLPDIVQARAKRRHGGGVP